MSNGLVAKKLTVKRSVHALVEMLKRDEDYRRAWKDNIAMAFKDEMNESLEDNDEVHQQHLHLVANKAADRFLNILMRTV